MKLIFFLFLSAFINALVRKFQMPFVTRVVFLLVLLQKVITGKTGSILSTRPSRVCHCTANSRVTLGERVQNILFFKIKCMYVRMSVSMSMSACVCVRAHECELVEIRTTFKSVLPFHCELQGSDSGHRARATSTFAKTLSYLIAPCSFLKWFFCSFLNVFSAKHIYYFEIERKYKFSQKCLRLSSRNFFIDSKMHMQSTQ